MPSLSHPLPVIPAPGFAGRIKAPDRQPERFHPARCAAFILMAGAGLWVAIFYLLGLVL